MNKSSSEFCESYDELLRLIGKTLLHFQQLELLMKRVLAWDSIKIFHGDTDEIVKTRMNEHQAKTMGEVIEHFLARICVPDPAAVDLLQPLSKPEPIIRMGLLIGVDPVVWRERLQGIKEDRNEFVHHLLSRINPRSEDSVRINIRDLMGLIDRLKPEIQHLQNLMSSVYEFIKTVSEELNDPDFVANSLRHHLENAVANVESPIQSPPRTSEPRNETGDLQFSTGHT